MAEDVGRGDGCGGPAGGALVGLFHGRLYRHAAGGASARALFSLSLGGVGAHYLRGPRIAAPAARIACGALLTDDKAGITDPRPRLFRDFADQPGKDRIALAACMRAMSPGLPAETLAQVRTPVLVVCGDEDEIAGPRGTAGQGICAWHCRDHSGRDHMSAVGDRKTRQAVLDFLRA